MTLQQYIDRIGAHGNIGDNLVVRRIHDPATSKEIQKLFPLRIQAYNLIIVNKGWLQLTTSTDTYRVVQGEVLEIEADLILHNLECSNDISGYQLLLDEVFLNTILHAVAPLSSPRRMRHRFLSPLNQVPEPQWNDLIQVIELLLRVTNDGTPNYRYRKAAILFSLIYLLLSENNEQIQAAYGDLPFTIDLSDKFRILVQEHFRQEHKVLFYAEKLNVTPDYLTKVVKEHTGRTSSEWIARALLSEALVLLRRPEYTVGRVAHELNFFDQTAFGKFFKKETGISPMAYRKGEDIFKGTN